jgi:hypothetical protein
VAEVEHAGEGVGEVDHEEGADEADDAADVGDGGGDDEGEDPVDGAEAVPGDLALAGGDGGEAEALLEDFEVDCLHADVEVHDCCLLVWCISLGEALFIVLTDCDETCQQGKYVTGRLKRVRPDDVDDVVRGVLAPEGVDKDSEQEVDDADEGLGAEETLPEVHGVAHLSEESNEEKSTGVSVRGDVSGRYDNRTT